MCRRIVDLHTSGVDAARFWEARLCFKQFADGQGIHITSCTAVCANLRLGSARLAWRLSSSALQFLLCLTINNPPGTQQVAIGIGTDQVLTLMFAAVVWVMASVIAQGQALAEENASFV